MNRARIARFGLSLFILLGVSLRIHPAHAQLWRFEKLDNFPNPVGVASPFAGQSGSVLLVAGGANFPDKKPWEGGKKIWHDQVYALEATDPDRSKTLWHLVGKLPRPLAYGISIPWNDRVVCVGGSDASQHARDVLVLGYQDSKLSIEALSDLPVPLANACGAIVDGMLILSGGIDRPDATECQRKTWGLDLKRLQAKDQPALWLELPEIPGRPRMLSTAATWNDSLLVIGGVTLAPGPDGNPVREYLSECWKFELDRAALSGRWVRQADLPIPLAASPGPAMVRESRIWIAGGDAGDQVGVAPAAHRGFSKKLYAFDPAANRWSESSQELPFARVTVPLVRWFDGWVIPSGEVKPGIRSSEVWWIGN